MTARQLDLLPVGVFQSDPQGLVVVANQRWHELTGLLPGQGAGTGWALAIHPEDLPRVKASWRQAVEAGHNFHCEYRYEQPDGQVAHVACLANPIHDRQGRVTGHLGVVLDISRRVRSEEASRLNEAHARALMDALTDAAFLMEPDGTIIAGNRAMGQRMGLDTKQVAGHNAYDFLPPEVAAQRRAQVARVVENGQPQSWDDQRQGRDLHNTAYPVKDAKGRVVSVAVVGQDVTAFKRALTAMHRHQEMWRAVADFTWDWDYWRAPDGALTYVSPSCQRITGHSAAEFVTRPELLWEVVHPDDQAKFRRHLEANRGLEAELDFRIITRDGKVRWIHHVCQAAYGEDGVFLGRRASNRDITERMVAVRALREESQRLNLALEATGGAMWERDLETGRTYLSPSWYRLYGYEPGSLDLDGDRWRELVHPDDLPRMSRAMQATTQAPEHTYRSEHRVRFADGQWRWVQGIGQVAERDEDGNPRRLVALDVEITQRKQMEAERESRAKLEGVMEMAGAACHELNQPLQALTLQLELLALKSQGNPELERQATQLLEQLQRMGALTSKIKRITRYETKEYLPHTKIVDIDKASRS